ncbi:MAG: OadG family transporter subunit [Bacteroidales bacterium]|nr:OadG family transporter subunit [Bacteroidales bacterium]
MKNYLLFLALMLYFPVFSQKQEDVRINEIMGINKSSIIDEFGRHQPWCELINTGFGTVNISGMYLSNDKNNLKKYQIPANNKMILPPQGVVVFFLDSNDHFGIFHTNFLLKPKGSLYLTGTDGKTIIDSISFSFVYPDEVLARIPDGNGNWQKSNIFTPGQLNQHELRSKTNEIFSTHDPYGFAVTIIAMSVVFFALILLTLIFSYTGKYFSRSIHIPIKLKKTSKNNKDEIEDTIELSSETIAAIAAAIYQYQLQLHDQESTILTIKKISKPYSPWSSKIYTLRQLPNKTYRRFNTNRNQG